MSPGQTVGLAPFLYAELSGTDGTSESRETLEWDTGGAGDELKQPEPLLVTEPENTKYNTIHSAEQASYLSIACQNQATTGC